MALFFIMNNQLLIRLTQRLARFQHRITCAESCTGGLLASAFTALSGSSAWLEMSFVTYSNQAKQQLLGVSTDSLEKYGAVSEPVVREMAMGALLKAQADMAIAISGIAGPTGGSLEKPVGTVWFGVAVAQQTFAICQHFDGNRTEIREQAVNFALAWLLEIHQQVWQ